MIRLFIFSALMLALFGKTAHADGVVGCGGFVRSDVEINFSLVEVKLYTSHGSIKYQTDCAPNTGYYLIPLYDKGDFVLKVEPPQGWTFEPESFELHVDGEKDKCSLGEDINFLFTGFSLNGMVVSRGQVIGPAGVVVTLHKAGSGEVLQTVQTAADGRYSFSKVLPGKYDVKAKQGDLRFDKAETSVEVKDGNADAGSALVVAGYTVTGKVYSEGEPIKGVNFLLYSSTVTQKDVHGCDKSVVAGMGKKENYDPLCHVISDATGRFIFPCLAAGEYYLIPFYKGEHITFDVKPEKLQFTVNHAPLQLGTTFQVAGFSVTGQVLDSVKGSGLAQAQIMLNGVVTTTSGVDGLYHLDNMKTGMYKVKASMENVFFEELEVKITPNTPHLPDIVPSKFNLCGQVTIEKFPEGLTQQLTKRKMIIFPEGKGSAAISRETGQDGRFCTAIEPGKYVVRVHMSDEENKAGLTISPSEHIVTISNRPVTDVSFSQFRAKVSGTVQCIEKCGAIEVSLDSISRNEKLTIQAQPATKGATFSFDNILPGKYKATILRDSLCWKEKSLEFEVGNKNVDNLLFTQTGYILKCTISHSITLNFAHEKKEGSVGSFELNKGKNRFCLAHPGVYKLTPDSCHKFEKDVYTYDTSNPETLTLTAISHLVYGVINAEQQVPDAMVTIVSSLDQAVTTLGPLTPDGDKATNVSKTSPQVYRFSHWTRSGEKLSVTVKSAEMLFSPSSLDVTVSGDTCPGELLKLTGEQGQFIVGHIYPPLAGVKVTVTSVDKLMEPVSTESGDRGEFKIGPLHKRFVYEVSAEKEGYVLEKDAGEMAVFKASKLGQIDVKMVDESGEPLADVLLSLSGGKQYRSNNLTGQEGSMLFVNLSPSQYFLRPMMKEYKFDPVSQMIDVLEGTTMDIRIKGVRVAYSCYGQVTSLNGEPEPGLFIEASGQGDCSMYQEESKTEQTGHYRIRGLQPNCTYEVRMKIGEMNKHIERAAPKSRFVVVEGADFQGLDMIAFRRMNQMDISGNVVTAPEHLNSLKVRLYKDDNPGVPMFTVPLGSVSFFYLPSLQMDNAVYSVRLESSMSKNTHDFVQPEVQVEANISYKHITFKFEPKRKSLEQELSQGSVLMLPLTVLAIFAIYNYQKLLPLCQQAVVRVQASLQQRKATPSTAQHHQAPPSDNFVLTDSPVAKKKKLRKT